MELGWGLTALLTPVLYGVALLTVLLTLFYRIEIGIYFLAFFLPLQNVLDYVNVYPMGKDINDILLAVLLVKWMLLKRKSGDQFLFSSPILVPIALLFIWTWLGVINGSEYLGMGFPTSLANPLVVAWKNYWMPVVLFFIVCNNIKNPRQIKILVLVTMASILMLDRNFYSILSGLDLGHYSDELKDKYLSGGISLSGNELAVFLAQYVVIFVALFFYDDHPVRKYFYLFTIALSYYCILFLFSRGGYLAAGAGLLFMGLIRERKLLLLLFIVFIFYQTLLPNAVIERIEMTKTESGYDGTALQRLGMWEQAQGMISEKPIYGWGFFITPFIEVKAGWHFGSRAWGSFHNNFFQTTVELGIIGLALVLWIYFAGMWLGWRLFKISQDPFAKGLGLGMATCAISILAGNLNGSYWHFFTISSFYWIYLALVVRLIAMEEKVTAEDEETNAADDALTDNQVPLAGWSEEIIR